MVMQLLQQANKHQLLSQNQLNMVGSETTCHRRNDPPFSFHVIVTHRHIMVKGCGGLAPALGIEMLPRVSLEMLFLTNVPQFKKGRSDSNRGWPRLEVLR